MPGSANRTGFHVEMTGSSSRLQDRGEHAEVPHAQLQVAGRDLGRHEPQVGGDAGRLLGHDLGAYGHVHVGPGGTRPPAQARPRAADRRRRRGQHSGPLVVAMAVPALAIAFWRNAFGSLAVGGYVAARPARRAELRALKPRELRLSATGRWVLLAVHFATWVPSLRLTSVASSVALVCLQPVWVVLIARARGHAVPAAAWVGIGIAFGGVLLLTGVDAGRGRRRPARRPAGAPWRHGGCWLCHGRRRGAPDREHQPVHAALLRHLHGAARGRLPRGGGTVHRLLRR